MGSLRGGKLFIPGATELPSVWEHEPTFWQADISRTVSELTWRPRFTLEQGLDKSINWFKENINLYT